MTARRILVDARQPDETTMAEAGRLIRSGGLVAFPTETVYGLGANALDAAAVGGIFRAKGRPANDPIIVHLAAREQLALVARDVPPLAARLIAHFWPGPLTLVLNKQPAVPPEVTAGLATVAVRMPAHPVALALIRQAGTPIAAPSANRFSRPSATTADHVMADLGAAIDLVLDAGPTTLGVESTILAVPETGMPLLLRPGGATLEALTAVVGPIELAPLSAQVLDHEAQVAPGLLTRHYAPRATMLLVVGERQAARARLRRELVARAAAGQRLGALLVREDADLLAGLPATVGWLGSEADLAGVAERLFAAMRAVDAAGVDVIGARDLGLAGLGRALLDRLTRAASGRVILADAPPDP